MNLVRKIAAGLGLPADDVTLSLLVSCAGGIQGGELADCQSTLSSLLHSIRDANNGNRALIDASLQFFGNSISFISELMSPRTGYLDTGKIKTVNRNGKILSVEG
jgi:flagellar biosynthesis/type III secretory pathway chaperone